MEGGKREEEGAGGGVKGEEGEEGEGGEDGEGDKGEEGEEEGVAEREKSGRRRRRRV